MTTPTITNLTEAADALEALAQQAYEILEAAEPFEVAYLQDPAAGDEALAESSGWRRYFDVAAQLRDALAVVEVRAAEAQLGAGV